MKKIIILSSFLWLGYFLQAQIIKITQYPEYGENALLHGTTSGINPAQYGVVCYVFAQEAGGWWGPKPSFTNPITPINPDGSFSLQFITGGVDEFATLIFVYLKHQSAPAPPQIEGNQLPEYLLNLPNDIVARPHGTRKFNWPNQNYSWTVKESLNGNTMGPGDNLFSASPANVWIDQANQLHLKINKTNGLYYSSEIIADTAFGYGKYSFVYNSNPDILDPKTVFGFFTWDDASPYAADREAWYREIDFEFSRWGNASDPTNAQFVIQPWEPAGNLLRYNTGTSLGTNHSFAWYKDSVVFESRKADSTLIKKWVYTGAYLPAPGNENMRINLWLMNKPPGKLDEIILGDYQFQYHLKPPQISATDGTHENYVLLEWANNAGYFYKIYRSTTENFSSAQPLNEAWFQGNSFEDTTAESGRVYFYWLRCADNPAGSNVSGYISDVSLPDSGFISKNQVVGLTSNWSGFSSFINPVNANPEALFQQIQNQLIIVKNQTGSYYPANGTNTLSNWNPEQGYIVKLSEASQMTFSGLPVAQKTLLLEAGWNLIPVISTCAVAIDQLFEAPDLVMVKEVAGCHLWWPEEGIYTLTQLQPGSAYFVLMNSQSEIVFPECDGR